MATAAPWRPAVTIEKAGIDDASALSRLHGLSFTQPGDERWDAAAIAGILTTGTALLARVGRAEAREAAGFLIYRFAADECEILSLGVIPEWRRHRIGRMLLETAIGRLSRQRIDSIFLEVAVDNHAARALYSSFGFKTVGRRPRYYRRAGNLRADALTLRYEL